MLQCSQLNGLTQEKKNSRQSFQAYCVYTWAYVCTASSEQLWFVPRCPWGLTESQLLHLLVLLLYLLLIRNGYISFCQTKLTLRIVMTGCRRQQCILKCEPCAWNLSFDRGKPFQIPGLLHNVANPVICFLIASTCKAGMSSANIPEISPFCHTTRLLSYHNYIPEKGYTTSNIYNILLQQPETDCTSWVGEKIA